MPAGGQLAPGNQPSYALSAYIQGTCGLLYIVEQRFRQRGLRSSLRDLGSNVFVRFHVHFLLVLFIAVIGDAPFFANPVSEDRELVSERFEEVSEVVEAQ